MVLCCCCLWQLQLALLELTKLAEIGSRVAAQRVGQELLPLAGAFHLENLLQLSCCCCCFCCCCQLENCSSLSRCTFSTGRRAGRATCCCQRVSVSQPLGNTSCNCHTHTQKHTDVASATKCCADAVSHVRHAASFVTVTAAAGGGGRQSCKLQVASCMQIGCDNRQRQLPQLAAYWQLRICICCSSNGLSFCLIAGRFVALFA